MSANKKKIKAVLPSSTAETFNKVKSNVANQMENTMQNAADQMEKANRQLMSGFEDVAAFNRNNIEAMMQASSVMAEGMKDLSQAMMAHMQQSMQSAVSTGKAMMGVKTMRELMDIQSEYVKMMMDSMMSDSTRISEIAVRVTTEAAEPLNARVNDVVEKISDRAKRAA
jgi:phasin family protein